MKELPYDVARIDMSVLTTLAASGAREGRHLDFKATLEFQTDSQKREILADFSSFANAGGGDILLGIREDPEDPGLMGEIAGLTSPFDETVLKLEESLRRGVNPRIPGLVFRRIDVSGGRYVLMVRIPKSQIAPHMVTHSESYRIFGRGSNGKTTLSVQEIRDLVLATESLQERLKRYRLMRASAILSADTPISSKDPPSAVLHLLPIESFTRETTFSATVLRKAVETAHLMPPGSGGQGWLPVFEGVVMGNSYGTSAAYTLVTREGIVEGVSTDPFRGMRDEWNQGGEETFPFIADHQLLEMSADFFQTSWKCLTSLQIAPPFCASIMLVGVRDHFVASVRNMRIDRQKIRQDVLDLGIVELDDEPLEGQWQTALRPQFERLANAGGMLVSPLWRPDGTLAY